MQPGTAAGSAAARIWQDRGAYSQADYGHIAFAWSAEESLRTGKYLYIQAPRRELYEDGTDARAVHNLASSSSAVADTLSAKLQNFQRLTTNTQQTPKARMDEAKIKKLAILGYMAARADSPYSAPGEEGADPKDKIQIAACRQDRAGRYGCSYLFSPTKPLWRRRVQSERLTRGFDFQLPR
jgi:hypothetical protein